MDCSKTEVFFSEKRRMCGFYHGICQKCNLSSHNNGANITCDFFCDGHTAKAIKIVQEWSDSHQPKTRFTEFAAAFPNHETAEDGRPVTCAQLIYGPEVECDGDCKACWDKPIEGE